MWHDVLRDPRLYALLSRYDEDWAEQVRGGGCPACGGRLHRADYPRKSRGAAATLERGYEVRRSFCCAAPECRRRRTPESVRFLGRRVYLGAVVLLGSALALGLSARRVAALREQLGVDRRTLMRWRQWWQESFVASGFWRIARGAFVPAVVTDALPAALLERFTAADPCVRVLQILTWLAPLSIAGSRAAAAAG